MIKTLALVALALCLAGAPTLAFAADSCTTQAMDKKLAGAAKTSFMKKCAKEFLRGAGGGQEAARRGDDLIHHEMREGFHGRMRRRRALERTRFSGQKPSFIASAKVQGPGRGTRACQRRSDLLDDRPSLRAHRRRAHVRSWRKW